MTDSQVHSGAEVRERALALLARREHSREELVRKLARRGFDDEIVTRVLDRLEQEKLLSDRRFAEGYVSSRASRGYGPLRIRAELGERGVPGAIIGEVLDRKPGDWLRRASLARAKRFGPALPETWREKTRQARFLENRGFEAEQIRSVVEHGTGEIADDLGENV